MIGGPKDGQIISIRKGVPFICVPVLQEPCTSVADSTGEPDTTFEEVTYQRRWMHDIDGNAYHVLVASGVTNPMQRLIAGYKPTNDSAGKE